MEKKVEDPFRLEECEKRLDYRFKNRDLLVLALTHASDKASHIDVEPTPEEPAPTPDQLVDNERLEFLGDAVLGMIVCEELFHSYPDATEGDLTAVKSVVVSRGMLAIISDEIDIPRYMSLGKGIASSGRIPESLRANVFEAVVAAIYLDGGLEEAQRFILRYVREPIRQLQETKLHKNYKSTLQQYAQREFGITPTYRVISEEGPDHIKEFEVVAIIGSREYAAGRGKSKKDAEQEAAGRTLQMLMSEQQA
jgi:ribonuclease-3